MTNQDKLKAILIQPNKTYFSDLMIKKIFESEYNQQAIDFLIESKTKINIEFNGLAKTSWSSDKVNQYEVTLKNDRHEWTYEFCDSVRNTEDGKSAKFDFYSVLACMDVNVTESFDDFCSDFGYEFKNESEYIKIKKTHLACVEQMNELKKLFTADQLEKLGEIR